MIRRRFHDLLIFGLLFILPLLVFGAQTVGGYTLLPTENLYQYEPFATYRDVVHAPAVPHNALLSDLVLENFQWKTFIRESISQGEIPLWNPHQFSGIPFMAAGQQSTLYPLSILYYILPLTAAYGWFTVFNLWLAGVFMFLYLRGIGVGRAGSTLGGVIYQLSAFMLISAVFPMIIGAAVWLPLLLLMVEFIIRQRSALGRPSSVPWVVIGAAALGFNIFAGHVELTYYTIIIAAYYAAARLFMAALALDGGWGIRLQHMLRRGLWLGVMMVLGFGLGALQFIPLFELVSANWRSGSASLQEVLGWAHPWRDLVQFVMPNFYGNPSHHTYFDLFTMQTTPATVNALGDPITTMDWGIKNYVEGALYLGILPLALAVWALIDRWILRRKSADPSPPYRGIFALLTLVSLTFMFGLPTYALLYYLFPGLNQSHTPFRWIYAVTLGVAVLAGFGLDALAAPVEKAKRWARRGGYALILIGLLILAALLFSRVFFDPMEPLIERVFSGMAKASEAFADTRMFYSYEFTNVLLFGLFILGTGLIFWWATREADRPVKRWPWAAVALVAVDLMIACWGFNPASDPLLLDFTPPAIGWLQAQGEGWRYTTLDDPAQRPLMNANVGWRYGLDDIRGYESIIPRSYVEYMQALAPQPQLDFNRIAPLYTTDLQPFGSGPALIIPQSPLLNLLNVRYIMTHKSTELQAPGRTAIWWKPVYEDEAVIIRENPAAVPRAYTVPERVFSVDWLPDENGVFDYSKLGVPEEYTPAGISSDTGREKLLRVSTREPAWLVVSETYFPGWRAYIQLEDGAETPLEVEPVLGNFQGVRLTETGDYVVRLVYSPRSFQVGGFLSFISGVLLLFMVGVWLWRMYVVGTDDSSNTVSRVARNSLAPIILNLFNRGIDFAFAAVMLRVLGPADAGIYQYAIVIFAWFDILTNFGLNTFLTREVARDRSRAGHYFFNTSIMRLVLIFIGVLPLVGFIAVRQWAVSPALDTRALAALGLLYIGLLPNSLSTGMTALFYAFEKAEYPSAVATIATINKAVFGVTALILGYGIIGLAGVSIFTNLLTLVVLMYGGRSLLRQVTDTGESESRRLDKTLIRQMIGESWPLMLNHFLAQIFFQIDIVLIEAMHGAKMVGQYGVAYKWVLAINIIPAFFTMALLPVMSRQAHENRPALKRSYYLAIKMLVSLALPTAVLFTVAAYPLTMILGGSEFLPDGAIALQLMIWSIPFGWMNSLTQYVLIALDLQRKITLAFIIAVTFNITINLMLIPTYGYRAAALTTIASELVLLLPFGWLLMGALGKINWLALLWRPLVAGGAMLAVMALLWSLQSLVALIVGGVVYAIVLLWLRPLTAEEGQMLAPLLPARLRNLPMVKILVRNDPVG